MISHENVTTILNNMADVCDWFIAALLTKYKGPNMEKAVIRPYTPVSDEGKLVIALCSRLECHC